MSQPIRVIAEFCQNHNGKFDVLRRMIDDAAAGGATHGKIQTIFAGDLSFRPEFEEGKVDLDGRTVAIKRPYQAEYDRLKGLELSYEQHREFADACRASGLEPLTTAFTVTSIPHLRDLGWRSVKVASYDCGSVPLIQALIEGFSEIIVSTGASYDDEVRTTARLLTESGRTFSLLHCVTMYPTPLSEMHLARLAWLGELAPSVGLSDHSLVARDGVKSALAAIFLGADTIERHFTVLPEEETRDGKVSIRKEHVRQIQDFAALSRDDQRAFLTAHVPEFDAMIGSAQRPLSDAELLNRNYYRGRFANKTATGQVFNWEPEARELGGRGE